MPWLYPLSKYRAPWSQSLFHFCGLVRFSPFSGCIESCLNDAQCWYRLHTVGSCWFHRHISDIEEILHQLIVYPIILQGLGRLNPWENRWIPSWVPVSLVDGPRKIVTPRSTEVQVDHCRKLGFPDPPQGLVFFLGEFPCREEEDMMVLCSPKMFSMF